MYSNDKFTGKDGAKGLDSPRELMMKAKNGDSQAFADLYDLYFTPVYRYIYHRVKNREEAEDLVQTVFVKAFKSASTFMDKGKEPLVYFFTIARNAVIDFWKKRKEVKLDDAASFMDSVPDKGIKIGEDAMRKDDMKMVFEEFGNLTADQREIITLKFVNDLSNKEIAEITGKREDAIRQAQSRAIKTLKKRLSDKYGR